MTLQQPLICRTDGEMRKIVGEWRRAGHKIALVPTMGALHGGHMSLVKKGFHLADRVIVSIFVNPTQFAEGEDFDEYPRTWDSDIADLTGQGVNAVYAPTVNTMYPANFATRLIVGGPALELEGEYRPNFFEGVATIVAKLLIGTDPDLAIFGEKDYQQLLVIKRMVKDLQIPIEILGAPTVREEDGLALSSRNQYLTETERKVAPKLYQMLNASAQKLRQGETWERVRAETHTVLQDFGFQVDYFELRDAETLKPTIGPDKEKRLLIAARLGKPRLIDNIAV